MRIVVIGAGAMGSLFGARLKEAGEDVVLVDVVRTVIDAVNRDGLRLEAGGRDRRVRLDAAMAADLGGTADLIIVFTKGAHTAAGIAAAAHLAGPATWALTLQNGLGNVEAIAPVIPRSRIAHGMTTVPAALAGPAHVVCQGDGEVRFWSADGAPHVMLEAIAAALARAGFDVAADPQAEVAIWEKIAFNAALNAVACAAGLTVGETGDHAASRAVARAIVAETLAVAAAKGIAVQPARVDRMVEMAFAQHRGHKPSMLQDLEAGRSTEIDSINGAVCRAGDALGVPVTVTWTLWQLVTAMSAKVARA